MLRQSRYNVVVEGEGGEQLLYNTANGAFAVLGPEGLACLEACGAGADSGLSEQLADVGFLTEATPDEELAARRELFEAQRADHSELVLVLAPTYACNYRCPYCYEQGHNSISGIMDECVRDAVCDFIEARYAEHAFASLSVQWYGGDPSLALDAVKDLSEWMMEFCDERGVRYSAMMLTNCNLIDADAADMLARCRVEEVLITIDGFEATHNARRVAANGTNSFERNIAAAKLFVERGIAVHAVMNVDRVNWPEFHELRAYLRSEVGVDLGCGRLCDYGHFFGERDFCKPAFDLFEHEEYCRLQHEEFAAGGYSAAAVKNVLAPQSHFCRGQRDDYYVIDAIGDVYTCDGWIGEKKHVAFSLFDAPEERHRHLLSHDPFESEQCCACKLLPLCLGNCDWERRLTGMQCHPLLVTLPDYLRDYRTCFGEAIGAFTHLA